MAIVSITKNLREEIEKKFKDESKKIFELIYSLEDNPRKGKELAHVEKILVKELKYENYRFYFVTDGFRLRFCKEEELKNLLIQFVRMSDKKSQQKTIDEIKGILKKFGTEGF